MSASLAGWAFSIEARMKHVRHHLSAIFGDMEEPALIALAEDIKAKGILDPVVMYEGQVLDGWHRCKAGQIAGVEIPYTEYQGDDPGGFVISKNLHRRQRPLTATQRAALVLQIHEWRPAGRPEKTSVPVRTFSNRELAAEAEVSEKTIEQAKVAHRAGLSDQMARGELSAKAAAEKAREAKDEPPKPKPLTESEKLKARIAELEEKVAEQREIIDDLTDGLESQEDAKRDEESQQVKFAQLREQIRALNSQVREWQNVANQWKRECLALRRRVGEAA
jgi:uncharacterized coiled-coil protein SlyX